ncbi:AB-hydrolase YheT [Cylindrobasidium torrendii FP15055 ss-10]|uniref:AB-hydrolase YheT n=1 Tax=Cylindrobasidium torrendii FP15055 ss-10 TaxID=1314674 RepID=A0A0D7B3Y0_9AGAR|nr:AB-hydrolase YheT [Cylindrobasidium torrendii FP15055 ss-10]
MRGSAFPFDISIPSLDAYYRYGADHSWALSSPTVWIIVLSIFCGWALARNRATSTIVLVPKISTSLDLATLVRAQCPSLFSEFKAPWWLANGHLQTIYSSVENSFSRANPVVYRRHLLSLSDGGTLGLDFAPYNDADLPEDTPIVIVLCGVAGGSNESYAQEIVAPTVDAKGLSYRAVVISSRGCNGVPLTSSRMFSAGGTDDVRQAVMFISVTYPRAPLLGLGFSLGANILTRYVAEEGAHSPLSSACVLACPWDLAANDRSILNTPILGRIYAQSLGTSLCDIARLNETVLRTSASPTIQHAITAALAFRKPTLREFHQALGRFDGEPPLYPFASAEAYFSALSSHRALPDIRIPFLAINAVDDPVVTQVPLGGAAGNPYVVMALTAGGGHIGWFESASRRWSTRPTLEWLKLTAQIPRTTVAPRQELSVDADGWIRAEAWPKLGVREKRSD